MEALTIFIKFLQACITPVAMISGVGLLLLTITNRMARVVDRIRQLTKEADNTLGNKSTKIDEINIALEICKGEVMRCEDFISSESKQTSQMAYELTKRKWEGKVEAIEEFLKFGKEIELIQSNVSLNNAISAILR